eukprot:2554727-Rhodomonas_salina.1
MSGALEAPQPVRFSQRCLLCRQRILTTLQRPARHNPARMGCRPLASDSARDWVDAIVPEDTEPSDWLQHDISKQWGSTST